MAQQDSLRDVLELAALLAPAWDEISAQIPEWHPRNEGDPDPDPAGGKDPNPDPDPDTDPDPKGGEPDWKSESRKHERRMKAERKAREDAERKLKDRDAADQTEQEKAIAKAREEAKAEAFTEAQHERRKDRLEVAVTRLAAKTFADTEDALLHVERAISDGDIDADDIYTDEGKVQTDALTAALNELLERKPHLKADDGRPSGDADAGKGTGPKDPESLGVEGHLKQIQRK